MEPAGTMKGIELVANGLEIVGVLVIGGAFTYASIRSLFQIIRKKLGTFLALRIFIGKALQVGLEFLVAADIIKTVSIKPTREGIVSLGLLILVRTFLSWSITVEVEGCWPWQVAKLRKD